MKQKQKRYSEVSLFDFVIEPKIDAFPKEHILKNSWGKSVFKNQKPLVLELGCGKGEYSIAMAKEFPEKNFIGIDLKGDRIWKGCQEVEKEGLRNIVFLRIPIERINYFFGKQEVSEMYIPFPDPFPKERHIKKRLTSPVFLQKYRETLGNAGKITLKTDNTEFFEYTLETLEEEGLKIITKTRDLYSFEQNTFEQKIKTYYEKKFLSMKEKIKWVLFTF